MTEKALVIPALKGADPIIILFRKMDLPFNPTYPNHDDWSQTFGGQLNAHSVDRNITQQQFASLVRNLMNAQNAVSGATVEKWMANEDVPRGEDVSNMLGEILVTNNPKIPEAQKSRKLGQFNHALNEVSRYLRRGVRKPTEAGTLIKKYCVDLDLGSADLAERMQAALYVKPTEESTDITPQLIGKIFANQTYFSPGLASVLILALDRFGATKHSHSLSENDRQLMADLYRKQILSWSAPAPIVFSIMPVETASANTEKVENPSEIRLLSAEKKASDENDKDIQPLAKETKNKPATISSLRSEIGQIFRFKREIQPLTPSEISNLTGGIVTIDEIKCYTRPRAERMVIPPRRQKLIRDEMTKVLEALEYHAKTIAQFQRKFDRLNPMLADEVAKPLPASIGLRSTHKPKKLEL